MTKALLNEALFKLFKPSGSFRNAEYIAVASVVLSIS